MQLKDTGIAGDKNFRHVVEALKIPSIEDEPIVLSNLKGMKEGIHHMGNADMNLDKLMICLHELKRIDVLQVLVEYCLSTDDTVDEDDVGGPGVQETGDDKDEMAVPTPEPSAATKLLS